MKKTLLAGLVLAASSTVFASPQNVIRMPVAGIQPKVAPAAAPLVVVQAPVGDLGVFDETATSGMGSYRYSFQNTGSVEVTTKSISVLGEGFGGQSSGVLSSNTCMHAIPPQGTCDIVLTPTAARPGTITLAFNETASVTAVDYRIVGEAPRFVYVSSNIVGRTKSFTLSNPNKAVPVTVPSLKITDNNFVDISRSFRTTGCIGTTIPAGSTCVLAVEYVPENGVQQNINIMPMMDTRFGPTLMIMMPAAIWW